jgi:NAD(P)-dependent dehydrogenase (short-subunit alcohol dehydrogenase family)
VLINNALLLILKRLKEKVRGKIISIASISAMDGGTYQYGYPYNAAKAGVIALTKSLALELAPYGINVNCISREPSKHLLLLICTLIRLFQAIRHLCGCC